MADHLPLREDDFEVRSQKEAMAIVNAITGGLTLLQFLLEALVISCLGGVVGAACGIGAVNAIALLTPLKASVDLPVVVLTIGLSGSIGLVFGVLPARRAAELETQ